MPRALATAQSVSTDGLPAPASSCDSVDFDTPAARASSLSDTPARRRSARRLLAICASGDGVTSPAASGPPICTGPVYQTFVRHIEQTSRTTHARAHTPSSHPSRRARTMRRANSAGRCDLGGRSPLPKTPLTSQMPKRTLASVRMTDPTTLRALAHPLRLDLIELLGTIGPATAAACARHLGVSQASASFHLRQLEAYGFAERAPATGDRRERPWRVTDIEQSWSSTDSGAAAQALEQVFVEREAAR